MAHGAKMDDEDGGIITDINVVPLVDITLVLLIVFMVASIAARGLRFFVVAGLLYWFGPPIKDFIEKYLGILSVVFVVLLIGGFVLIKYVL